MCFMCWSCQSESTISCSTSAVSECLAASHLDSAPAVPCPFPSLPRIPVRLSADHCDCLIRAHVFKERKYIGFPTSRNILLLGYFLIFFEPPILLEFLLTTCYGYPPEDVLGSSTGRHCSVRESKLGANCNTKASRDSDSRLRGK